ncbi:TPA: hypothetical protein ACJ51R_000547 [Streptococcus suis]
MKFLVTRNVVIETAKELKRFVTGEIVELTKAEANRLNKSVSSPFLVAMKDNNKEFEEVAE